MKILRGTSIIEIVVAAALISVAIIAALSLANYSQKQNNYARGLAEATKYNSQAIDWIRTQRESLGWSTIASKAISDDVANIATYCLDILPSTSGGTDFTNLTSGVCVETDFIVDTLFTREMTIDTTNEGSGVLKITVVVSWMEEVERQATVETELTQWN